MPFRKVLVWYGKQSYHLEELFCPKFIYQYLNTDMTSFSFLTDARMGEDEHLNKVVNPQLSWEINAVNSSEDN